MTDLSTPPVQHPLDIAPPLLPARVLRNDAEAIVYQLPERSEPTAPPADAGDEQTGGEDAGNAASDLDVTSVPRPSA